MVKIMLYPFRDDLKLLALPYSDIIQKHYQLRGTRSVYCQYCKYSTYTILYGAKCGICKSFLIETPRFNMNNGELAE